MKKNLLLYLFIFTLLINLFTYVYFTKNEKYAADKAEKLTTRIESLKDSLNIMTSNLERADYFSLKQNLNARHYFDEDPDEIAIRVRDDIYAKNKGAKGNPLIQYPVLDGKSFVINKIKLVNNRWIIADFTNGKAWGEIFIKYFIEDNGDVSYETVETLLHANTIN
ncbi:MAG: hypothetical protein BM557_07135 [Flavobacterium sp. MedPE-SWcel]|uniref:hypothetical protein n=1 Tax=uncultured Flavobacterium sp. TaxID=165435 RepID=UPI000912E778|nr:hypothetical protein [uncultured Flavobacterium sp.]OIQ18687.1 MAG: hypothetical protein BM557_07135 [Flavobacterium sp. MedPE-SWcel]